MKGLLLTLSIAAFAVGCGDSDTNSSQQKDASLDKEEALHVEQEVNTLDSINQEILESSEMLDVLLKEIN